MIKPELYQRTVDILVEAYFNDTLEHQNCRACAVGNLVAANMGMKLMYQQYCNRVIPSGFWLSDPKRDSGMWYAAISSGIVLNYNLNESVLLQINATGYSPKELAKIEFAFENAPFGSSDDEYMFNGLMAVIDVLDEIHQNTDTETTNATKQRFICQH